MVETVQTFCRNCSALCAMHLDIEDGRPVRARPDGSISPYGAYLCPKGQASVEFHQGAEGRLLSSLVRQPDGSHVPIDSQLAMAQIGDRLAALVAKFGPRSVAFYHGTGAYRSVLGALMQRDLVAQLDTPNFFTTMTIDQSAKMITMGRMGTMASGKNAIRDADLALLAGGNPLVSHQGAPFAVAESGAPARSLEAFKARGGRLIVIDPRRTETARYADLLIQPLPGHDATIFAAMAHILLRDNTFDMEFATRHCSQVEALRQAVAPFTPDMAALRADVPIAQIEQAARWLGEAKRPVVGSGTGPSMSDHSNLADHMIVTVNALVGGYRRVDDLVRNPGTLRTRQPVEMAVPPNRTWERGPRCLSEDTGAIFGEFPAGLIPREITANSPDRIRALIVFGGDPLMAVGDPAAAAPAFAQLDLLVSLDCRMNATAQTADYVIASSQPFERHDITVSADSLFPEAFAQYTPPVIPRPANVVHDWEFFWTIAARMGLPLTFKFWNYGLVYADIADGLPLGLTDPPDGEALCRFIARDSAVPFEELKANPGGLRPALAPCHVQPAPPGWEGRLALCPDDVAADLAAVAAEPPETAFPFRLTSRRILHALNGAFRDSRGARRRHPVNYAFMNPDDMTAAGIAEDAQVEIASAYGTIRTLARSEDRLRRGVVSMTHMFGPLVDEADPLAPRGANVGQLTSLSEHLQPINFMPRFSAVPVSVSKS